MNTISNEVRIHVACVSSMAHFDFIMRRSVIMTLYNDDVRHAEWVYVSRRETTSMLIRIDSKQNPVMKK